MRNFESSPHNQEPKEKPEWVQNLRVAFGAWKNADKAMIQELGEREGLMGDIHRKLNLEVATIFHNQISSMRDLPSFVPLEQDSQVTGRADVDVENENATVKFSQHSQPTERKYFLPQTHELYVEMPFATMNPESRKNYLPESKSFKGFEEIKKEKKTGGRANHYSAFYDFYDLTPPTQETLEQESRKLSFQFWDTYPRGEYDKAQASQRTRDRYGLSPEQICEIISHLEGTVKDEGDCKKLEAMKNDVNKTLDAFPEKLNQVKEKNAEHIKQRIINLTNFLLEDFKKDLPKSISIGHHEYDENHNKIASYFYMPHEKKLIKAPYKKGFLSDGSKPDFSKAEDAPEEEWLHVGLLGDMLLNIFPDDIRNSIKK
ncbi:MAG: hypothetical protein COU29_00635 [Candidatus Magasanikbacteria bacterium CG10_big_fil_rev_8_21_14_0_10_36_32]|uniref:Uncharacterized protein n=1 Tax=Candidatus Magasanikbacteria bacterium CG10_big_fil_rev_8_21_14_0_10_36_32 TaxID=1974646 RepID=A0A2M6W7F2_9BACT|nr:MAG: hypothetical protein COU29_00635 [Candidatus Magasanikbacteria bacterium CG10_big_fil_rev_8_21_14_0_10_36_32]